MSNWKKVFATHEERQGTSLGDWPGDMFPGVALPSKLALTKWVELRYGDKWTIAQVRDVGPWATDDDAYVFGDSKPRAEIEKGQYMDTDLNKPGIQPPTVQGKVIRSSNGAAVDLFPAVAKALGIPIGENVTLEWRFLNPNS